MLLAISTTMVIVLPVKIPVPLAARMEVVSPVSLLTRKSHYRRLELAFCVLILTVKHALTVLQGPAVPATALTSSPLEPVQPALLDALTVLDLHLEHAQSAAPFTSPKKILLAANAPKLRSVLTVA